MQDQNKIVPEIRINDLQEEVNNLDTAISKYVEENIKLKAQNREYTNKIKHALNKIRHALYEMEIGHTTIATEILKGALEKAEGVE